MQFNDNSMKSSRAISRVKCLYKTDVSRNALVPVIRDLKFQLHRLYRIEWCGNNINEWWEMIWRQALVTYLKAPTRISFPEPDRTRETSQSGWPVVTTMRFEAGNYGIQALSAPTVWVSHIYIDKYLFTCTIMLGIAVCSNTWPVWHTLMNLMQEHLEYCTLRELNKVLFP